MHFDDRLATVLRHRAAGDRAARTQFRQLLDLLGRARDTVEQHRHEPGDAPDPPRANDTMFAAAWLRLGALGKTIPPADRARMIREAGAPFRNPDLTIHLSEDEPEVAAAAIARTQLDADSWIALIPDLPVRARGFLRLRRDLPEAAARLLDDLGVHDRGLPRPSTPAESGLDAQVAPNTASIPPVPANDRADPVPAATDQSEIGTLVKRIEAFRAFRSGHKHGSAKEIDSAHGSTATRVETVKEKEREFRFTTDATGRIDWADGRFAPMAIGISLHNTALHPAMKQRQPIRQLRIALNGGPVIAGDWTIDAMPRFTNPDGRFFGYAGLARRASAIAETATPEHAGASDRMRQLLHELRTPVNAIQGFAEIIQQQLYGPTPHEYRALAATIAGDSARMLAGFDELDRLAQLEMGALAIDQGDSDFTAIAAGMVDQLNTTLRPRNASMKLVPALPGRIAMDHGEAEVLAWRLLATLTDAIGAEEHLQLEFTQDRGALLLGCELPSGLAAQDDIFSACASDSQPAPSAGILSAGMFGTGFSLRLARAEAGSIGGSLLRVDDWLVLSMPLLTMPLAGTPSTRSEHA